MPEEEEDRNNFPEEEDEEDLEGGGEDEETDEEEDLEDDEDEEEEDDEEELTKPQHDEQHLHSVSPITIIATTTTTATTLTATTATIDTVETPVIVSDFVPDHKRQRIVEPLAEPLSSSVAIEEKKPSASALDDSRRLFQRLWTDEDEIGLLQGFLEFTTERGFKNSAYHHDTAPFYDQIKSRLQLDFNKNQLVEKLRRLKKKYRNVMNRISSGKDFTFKSAHDQATFEISRKIWSGLGGVAEAGIEEEEGGNPLNTDIINCNNGTPDVTNSDKKVSSSRSRKRSRVRVPEENLAEPSNLLNCPVNSSLPNVIEDTVRSCLSPLIKEFLSSGSRGFGSMAFSPLPLNFGGNASISGEMMDEKWRKQQILELEVYAKRMELVQEQIKLALEELKSNGSR